MVTQLLQQLNLSSPLDFLSSTPPHCIIGELHSLRCLVRRVPIDNQVKRSVGLIYGFLSGRLSIGVSY